MEKYRVGKGTGYSFKWGSHTRSFEMTVEERVKRVSPVIIWWQSLPVMCEEQQGTLRSSGGV